MELPKARPGVGRRPAALDNVAPPGGIALQGVRTLAASPAITVCETYNYVWGYSASTNATLSLTLKSGATVKGKGIARTDGVGYFSGHFFNQGAPVGIEGGDTVQVSNGTVTTTIDIPTITGIIDPVTDIVSGTISGVSLPVSVTIDIWPAPTEIVQANMVKTVSTDLSGNFSADFSDLVDIGADYVAKVTYTDANGNHVHTHLYVQAVNVYERFDRVFGYASPEASVGITVRDSGGSTKAIATTTADFEDGSYDVSFDVDIEPDDTVEVTVDGTTRSVVVADLTATMDLAGDDVLGTAPPTSTVRIYVWHLTDLGWRFYPKTVTSDEAGNYTADYSGVLDIGRYDYVFVCHPDGEGDETIFFYWPPLACVNVTYNNVWGFATPGANVTATLKDSLGVVKDIQTVTAGPWGYYEPGFSEDVMTGDIVEVSGGGVSATIPVQNLTADVDLAADTISGLAPASRPMIVHGWRSYAPGFNRTLTSGADGTYSLDLSGQVDLYNGYEGHIYYSQADDHKVFLHYHTPEFHIDINYAGLWGFVPIPHAPVTICVEDSEGAEKWRGYFTAEKDGHLGLWRFEVDDGVIDLLSGDRVIVEWGEAAETSGDLASLLQAGSQTVEIPDLWADEIDVQNDVIRGHGPANSLLNVSAYYWAWRQVPTDGDGNFVVDFSDLVDIQPGAPIVVGWYDGNWNEPYRWQEAPWPQARVNYTHDWIDGAAAPDATVNITVTRGGQVIGTAATTTRPNGYFGTDVWSDGEHVDIQPGDRVQVTGGGLDETIDVITIEGEIDPDADTVSGQMFGGVFPAQGRVEIWHPEGERASMDIDVDADGNYLADFSGEFDIELGDQAEVWYYDPNLNRVGVALFTPYLQANVNQSHDWVNGEATPDTTVYVTVTRGSEVIGTGQDHIESGTWFHIDPEDEWGDRTDIRAGDVVEVATSEGLTATIEVITITADIDPDNDIVSGQMLGGVFPAEVDVEVWSRDGTGRRVQTDGAGNYSADLSPFDLKGGHEVAVWYINPDGHRVGIVRSALRVEVNITYDEIEGATVPEATVTITVTGSGVKGTASTVANEEGQYWTEVYTNGEWVDIVPGDTVIAEAAGRTATVDIPDPFTAEIDVDTDTVYGQGPAGAELRVDVYGYGDKWVTVEPDGSWSVWFGDRGDLQAGDRGEVDYYTDEGHVVWLRFYSLYVRVNQSHDTVDGNVQPNVPVTVTLLAPDSTVKGVSTTWSEGDGYFWTEIDDLGGDCCVDIRAHDTVHVEAGDSFFDVFVIPMTGDVNPTADTVCGQMFDGTFPAPFFVDIWGAEGDTYQEGMTDEFGNYCADYSGSVDIRDGHEAFVVYINPDGNQVGIVRCALRIGTNIDNDDVWGDTIPEATVSMTLTGSSVKGVATAQADKDGRYWTEFFSDGQEVDILFGDTIYAEVEGKTATLQLIALSANTDVANDEIYGIAPPNLNVWVEVWDYGGKWTTSDESGYYNAWVGDLVDLEVGHRGEVGYENEDGHRVEILFTTLFGDVNCDCEVDVADIMQVASRWRMTDEDPHWDPRYDLDGDGIVTIVDIMKVATCWGETCD